MNKVGLYIHVPFRIYKHNHRSTLSFCNMDTYIDSYFRHLLKELELRKNDDIIIDSIYVGGGDPSSLNSDYIDKVITFVKDNYKLEENCEKTIELDPLCPEFRIKNFIRIGFNRFSIKVFTFDNKGLEYLDISHTKDDVIDMIRLLRRNNENNINLDMYFAYPGQTLRSLKKDFQFIKKINIPHISFYSFLDYDDIDSLYFDKDDIDIKKRKEEEMLDEISIFMSREGFNHYEINHFSRNNMESYHNQKYWNLYDYLGVGLGASGLIGRNLYKNEIDFEEYFKKLDKNELPYLEKEDLTDEEYEKNYIISKLGMKEGINIPYFNKRFNTDFSDKYDDIINKYIEDEILVRDNDNIKFTDKGVYLSNNFYIDII